MILTLITTGDLSLSAKVVLNAVIHVMGELHPYSEIIYLPHIL